MAKIKDREDNLADKIPVISERISWDVDGDGLVTIHQENRGVMKRLTQILLKKPKVSHVHLDEIGSGVWILIDGKATVADIAGPFEERFGERVHPTYERLGQYFSILVSYGFVEWKNDQSK